MNSVSDTRAVSEVIGYVLVFSMILTAIAFVSVSGFATLDDAKMNEQTNNAERAFDVLANNIEDVHRRDAPSRATELSLGDGQLHTDNDVGINVSVDGTWINRTVTPLVFSGLDDADTTFVYEGGAVFRNQRSGGITVLDPPIKLDEDRMILPLVRTYSRSTRSLGGSTVLVRTVATDTNVSLSRSGSDHDVIIAVSDSPRQELWGNHLESKFDMDCTVSSDTVVCERGPTPDQVLITVHHIRVELES